MIGEFNVNPPQVQPQAPPHIPVVPQPTLAITGPEYGW